MSRAAREALQLTTTNRQDQRECISCSRVPTQGWNGSLRKPLRWKRPVGGNPQSALDLLCFLARINTFMGHEARFVWAVQDLRDALLKRDVPRIALRCWELVGEEPCLAELVRLPSEKELMFDAQGGTDWPEESVQPDFSFAFSFGLDCELADDKRCRREELLRMSVLRVADTEITIKFLIDSLIFSVSEPRKIAVLKQHSSLGVLVCIRLARVVLDALEPMYARINGEPYVASRRLLGTLTGIANNARGRRHVCLAPGCEKDAIGSHVLQQHGVLDQLAEHGKLMVLEAIEHAQKPTSSLSYRFFSRDTGHPSLKFPGFCNTHDCELFKDAEARAPDYRSKRVATLLSYRAFANELKKVERNAESARQVRRDDHVGDSAARQGFASSIMSNVQLEIMRHELHALSRASREEGRFGEELHFVGYLVRRLPIVASVTWYPTQVEVCGTTDLGRIPEKMPTQFLHLVPREQDTVVILGGKNRRPTLMESAEEVQKTVSDILLRNAESWAVDPRWYRSCLEPCLAAVLCTIEGYLPTHMKEAPVCLNLFDLVPVNGSSNENDSSRFERFEIS